MSCAILNTMKLCISRAQTDISGAKALSYIYGLKNIGSRHEACFQLCSQSAFVTVKWSDVLVGRNILYKLNWF